MRAQMALGLSQKELADLLGVSARSIIRWRGEPGRLPPQTVQSLAGAVFAVDRALAAEIAERQRTTLEDLGIAAPRVASLGAEPALLVDSVVSAAAEALSTTPQAVRPAVLAAFERAKALELEIDAVRDALRPRATESAPRRSRGTGASG
jgi:transcriptional regulator with XRE-family HTH domain